MPGILFSIYGTNALSVSKIWQPNINYAINIMCLCLYR